jgi:hypothetical protein
LSLIRSLGVAWWACKGPLRLGRDLSTWIHLTVLTIFRSFVLLLLMLFHRPELVSVGQPLVAALGGPASTHYPTHLLELPAMFARIDALVIVAVGTAAITLTVRSFGHHYSTRHTSGSTLAAVPHVLLVLGLLLALQFGVDRLFLLLPEALQERGGKLGLALLGARLGVMTVLGTFVLYAVAEAALGAPAWRAIGRSYGIATAEPIGSFVLVAIWAAVTLPFVALVGPVGADRVAVHPEAFALIVFLRLLAELFLFHLLLGASTRIVVWKRAEARL